MNNYVCYDDILHKYNEFNDILRNKVYSTSRLDDMQEFYIKAKKKQKYESMPLCDIYKLEYDKVDRILDAHIKRGILDIAKVFSNLELDDNYIDLAKVSYLLHDVARRVQFIFSSSLVDAQSYNKEQSKFANHETNLPEWVDSHAMHGAYLLESGLFDFFYIPYVYRDIIYSAVKHHSLNELPINLRKKLSDNLFDGRRLTEMLESNDYEKLVKLYTQTVKSVDNFDLNNKVLSGDIPLVRESFTLVYDSSKGIKYYADKWGISEKDLRNYNNISHNATLNDHDLINIPTKLVPMEKFKIPDYYLEMLKNDSFPPKISTLQVRDDYNFLIAQIFRLSLLRNIEFKSLLKVVNDNNMLDRMLKMYPDSFQKIMNPIFNYAQEEIVNKNLEDSTSKIYTKSRKNY